MPRKLLPLLFLPCLLFWSYAATPTREFAVEKGRAYSLLVSAARGVDTMVTYTDPSGTTIAKALHAGDADFYLTLKPQASGKARIAFEPPVEGVDVTLTPMPTAESKEAQIAGS